MDREMSSTTIDDFFAGVEQEVKGDGRHAVVWAPYPHHDPPKGMERPVYDGDQWRPYAEVDAEASRLVLITPSRFDRETWTAPETPSSVPPEPDFA